MYPSWFHAVLKNIFKKQFSSLDSKDAMWCNREKKKRIYFYIIFLNTHLDNTLFWLATLDILQTVSNFATTCQQAVIRVLVDCLLNIF